MVCAPVWCGRRSGSASHRIASHRTASHRISRPPAAGRRPPLHAVHFPRLLVWPVLGSRPIQPLALHTRASLRCSATGAPIRAAA